MPIDVNARLNIAFNASSLTPAINSIQNTLKGKKIPLQVEFKIPKDIDREIYRVNRAFTVLDNRMRSLKDSSEYALAGIEKFVKGLATSGEILYKSVTPGIKSLENVAKATNKVTNNVASAKQEYQGLAEAIGVSAKKFVSFAIAAGVIANLVFQLQRGFSAALEFDKELVRLRQIGGDSSATIQTIADEVTHLSKSLGVSSRELIQSANTLRQAGLSAKETKVALDVLAKTTLAPTFGSINNTTEALIATLAQFGKGVYSLEKQFGSINSVAAATATEAEDLTQAIIRAGGAFVSAGGSLEELLALFTSVRSTTRESAESISTSFRNIFARLQRPDTIKNLDDLGVKLLDLEHKFVGPFEAVLRLNHAFKELPKGSTQFSKIVEEIGGIRQISKSIPLILQAPKAIEAYNIALSGQNSLAKDAALAQEIFLVKIQKVKESFLELFRTIVANDAFRILLDQVINLTQALSTLLNTFKPLIPLISAFTVFKAVVSARGFAPSVLAGYKRTRFASGGTVPGAPGSGVRIGTDTVPALLTEGEYVINKTAAKKIGYDVLDNLNNTKGNSSIGVRMTGGGMMPFGHYSSGGMVMPFATYAKGNRVDVNDIKSNFDDSFIKELKKLVFKEIPLSPPSNEIPLAPIVGRKLSHQAIPLSESNKFPSSRTINSGFSSNLPPVPLYEPPIELDSLPAKISGIPLSKPGSKGFSSGLPVPISGLNQPPIGLDTSAKIGGIPLSSAGNRGFSSDTPVPVEGLNQPPIKLDALTKSQRAYLDAKKSGIAAAQSHFGFQTSGFVGGNLPSTETNIESKSFTDKIKSLTSKIKDSLTKSSSELVEGAVKFDNEIVNGVRKITVKMVRDGKEIILQSDKSYNVRGVKAADRRKTFIEESLKSGKLTQEELLGGIGGFSVTQTTDTTRLGKLKSRFSKYGTGAAVAGAIALPYLSDKILGSAETPGSYGTSGARTGNALTAGVAGAALGGSVGSAFGGYGIAIGAFIGAITSVIGSLNQFDKELSVINNKNISKALGELEIDANTGKVKNSSALTKTQKLFEDTTGFQYLFDKDKFAQDKKSANSRFGGLSLVGQSINSFFPNKAQQQLDNATSTIKESSDQLANIVKAGITAKPNADFESFENYGPKIAGGKTALQLLKAGGNTDVLNSLKDFQKLIKDTNDIQEKINYVQNATFASLKDLNTALSVLSDTVDYASEKFVKNAAFNAVGSEALGGKVSAGSVAPSLKLFGNFGAGLEEFSKPGGILEKSRGNISKSIAATFSNLQDPKQPEDLENIGELAAKRFSFAQGDAENPYNKRIAQVIKNTVSSRYANTSKLPEGLELEKLTDEVLNEFKNIKAVRDSVNKQLESIFTTYSQQVSGNAAAKTAVVQKVAETKNRNLDFSLTNIQNRESFFGNASAFGPLGATSSQEIANRAEVDVRGKQLQNQLTGLGIPKNLLNEKNLVPTQVKLLDRLEQKQSALVQAQKVQKGATNLADYKSATDEVVRLTNTIANLKKGMDLLANSTSVLEAKNKVLATALDQQREDIEGRKSDAEILTFGSLEEKQKLFYKEQLTQTALQNPQALNFATDEEKKLIQERLHEGNVFRGYQAYDKYGRERGTGFLNSQQQLEGLTNPIYQQLLTAPGAQYARGKVLNAQLGVKQEQDKLNFNAAINNNVDVNDVNDQKKLIEQNFSNYINNINEGLKNQGEVFKDFSDSVALFGEYVDNIPKEITVKLDQNTNLSIVGINKFANDWEKIANRLVASNVADFFRNNNILTEDSPAIQ